MKVYRARLSKSGLLETPPRERKLFLTFCHIHNEIRGLQKLLLWSSDFSPESEPIVQGRISLSLMLLRILAGKLNEAHEVVRKYFHHPEISKIYNQSISRQGRKALIELKRYFASKNVLRLIRTNYAFHYSPTSIDFSLEGLPDHLDLYMEEGGSANNLFYFAEVLVTRDLLQLCHGEEEGMPVADAAKHRKAKVIVPPEVEGKTRERGRVLPPSVDGEVPSGDGAIAFDTAPRPIGAPEDGDKARKNFARVIQEVLRIARLVNDFTQEFAMQFVERHKDMIWEGTANQVSLGKLAAFSSVKIDWFTDTANLSIDYGLSEDIS